MKLTTLLRALPAALTLFGAHCTPVEDAWGQTSLDGFVEKQADTSIQGVLANIGTDGSEARGAAAGVIIASPSKIDPDYFSTWTRNSALTYKALVERFIDGDAFLQQKIDDYVSSQAKLQTLSNPPGGPDSGGMGEPRFNVDETAFTGSWDRPQHDGPSLRATTLTIYASWLIANGQKAKATEKVWLVIAKDLAYSFRYWNQTGFDLWEETVGSSFFTISAVHRALAESADLATRLGKSCSGCAEAAP
jgi:glucoamylase